jgi:hypothetical protein
MLNHEDSERIKKVIKYVLIGGIGAAAIYNIRKGDKWGFLHFREIDPKRFFLGVIQEGREKINQLTGAVSDYDAALAGKEFDVDFDEYAEPSDDDIAEIESVFIDERQITTYNEP